MRPYSKQTVRDAALLCDLLASNRCATFEAADALGVREASTAFRLACEAQDAISLALNSFEINGAEAAALIRSGWRIGEPVRRLPAYVKVVADPNCPADRVYIMSKQDVWPLEDLVAKISKVGGKPDCVFANPEILAEHAQDLVGLGSYVSEEERTPARVLI